MTRNQKAAPAGIDPHAILDVVEWLTGDECHGVDDAGLVAGLGRRLQAAGLPIDRLTLHLRTLHPEILGRSIAWSPGEPVEIHDREYGMDVSAAFAGSPLRTVMERREPVDVRFDEGPEEPWMTIDVFRGRGLVEMMAVPLCNLDGPVSAAAFCTARPRGFSESERMALERVLPALRTVCELRTLRQTELTLLDTYIGPATARRILAGKVRRGEVETLEAAFLLCDLHSFTELSNRLPAGAVLDLLSRYYDRVVPAITAEGGEVLKFMGDGVLAFFHREQATAACAAALRSALSSLGALDRMRGKEGDPLQASIALHFGAVSYGNIGSGQRLDFTLVGPDINLLSRIEAACGASGHPLLMSSRFAGLLPADRSRAVGHFALKGFAEPAELWSLHEPPWCYADFHRPRPSQGAAASAPEAVTVQPV